MKQSEEQKFCTVIKNRVFDNKVSSGFLAFESKNYWGLGKYEPFG